MPLHGAICRSLERKLLIFLGLGFFFASQLRWRSAWRAKLAREPEGRGDVPDCPRLLLCNAMPRYPVPDRSNFTPNQCLDDDWLPEGDINATSGTLPDGRPYVLEGWFAEGMTLVTYFFSVRDLEEASPEQLLALLQVELEAAKVPEKWRKKPGVLKILDASGNEMYSLTFVVGMPPF